MSTVAYGRRYRPSLILLYALNIFRTLIFTAQGLIAFSVSARAYTESNKIEDKALRGKNLTATNYFQGLGVIKQDGCWLPS